MKIKVQTCWTGHKFCFRALVCGGLIVQSEDGIWTKEIASQMLDILQIHGYKRENVRFNHV